MSIKTGNILLIYVIYWKKIRKVLQNSHNYLIIRLFFCNFSIQTFDNFLQNDREFIADL